MAKFQKGVSGNPKGRPPKERALTTLLENAGAQKIELPDGTKVEGRKFLADMLWNAAATGRVEFSNGRSDLLAADDWFSIVTFIYKHVDGAPVRNLDVTSTGEPITLNIMGVIPDADESDNQPLSATG
jgi:hypothetical protein